MATPTAEARIEAALAKHAEHEDPKRGGVMETLVTAPGLWVCRTCVENLAAALKEHARAAVEEERGACAELCDDLADETGVPSAWSSPMFASGRVGAFREVAMTIRSRSKEGV